ncbi:MAG: MarR family winged helix-turn-helix transcriptional regulator, partial [Roseibium sp.]|uniref:MarR family winged helix-turn-helix transcriptional regulator n=1 Tax=Roseibium sp. TaxID=1936156 RepID=UPI00262318A5
DRLVAAGLAEKRKSPEDGRGIVVVLTRKGADMLEEMWPVYRAAIQSEFAFRLSEGEAEALYKLLGKVLSPDAVD